MKIAAKTGREDIAIVYVAEYEDGELVEFVEALQPPKPREEKWVLLVSTLYGCPVECGMCDAGGFYHGKVSKERLFEQIDYMVTRHYPDRAIPSKQFKIQFARMGEPAFNPAVLDVLDEMPERYDCPGFMPSISTIAPHGREAFFERLLEIKREKYSNGNFQFQFSLHTTDQALRDEMIPVKKWDFTQMAAYGERFYQPGDRKITLNFALANEAPVEAKVMREYFDPEKFLVKITPLNPTYRAENNGLTTYIDPQNGNGDYKIVRSLEEAGYRVIISIGDTEESLIGSNCGQYLMKHLKADDKLAEGYLYKIEE